MFTIDEHSKVEYHNCKNMLRVQPSYDTHSSLKNVIA